MRIEQMKNILNSMIDSKFPLEKTNRSLAKQRCKVNFLVFRVIREHSILSSCIKKPGKNIHEKNKQVR